MKFYSGEIKDLMRAWFFISLAFAILFSGGLGFFSNFNNFIIVFGISAFTVGIAFLFHEIMHKAVAERYGFRAGFQSDNKMLWLALIMSFLGFIIAAPGAVVIQGWNISKEKNGKISLAGPLTNIVLALLFFVLLFGIDSAGIISLFLTFGFRINSFLALFNLIPIMPFDGKKILDWNKPIYFLVFGLSFVLFILSFLIK